MKVFYPARRRALASIALLAAAGLARGQVVPWSGGAEPPKRKAPAGAIDCHHHIYNAKYPVDPRSTLRPADASVEDMRLFHRKLGVSRSVIVQPSTYGTDNSLLRDSLKAIGPAARGIAVVDASVTDAELRKLHEDGVRGIRFNLGQPGGPSIDQIEALSRRAADLGWVVKVQPPSDKVDQIADVLRRLPSKLAIDHMGRITRFADASDPRFKAMAELVEKGNTWVTLSGIYYMGGKDAKPGYADAQRLAQAWMRVAPERMVWGSNWPHPTDPPDHKPDDAALLDLVQDWIPDQASRVRLFVDNPAKLFDF